MEKMQCKVCIMHRKCLQANRTYANILKSVEVNMLFLATLIKTVIKMVIIAAVAFSGILFGRYLRTKKDEKEEK